MYFLNDYNVFFSICHSDNPHGFQIKSCNFNLIYIGISTKVRAKFERKLKCYTSNHEITRKFQPFTILVFTNKISLRKFFLSPIRSANFYPYSFVQGPNVL